MSVDFNALLSTNLDEVEKPKPLPVGTYTYMIEGWEQGESSLKGTPYVQFNCIPVSAGEDVSPSDLEGINLAKKKLRYTCYLTPDAMYRLKDFLKIIGISTDGRRLKEALADTKGALFQGHTLQKPSTKEGSTDVFNEIDKAASA